MQEQTGNLWDIPADYRIITTNGTIRPNGDADMSDGTARQARERYPDLPGFLGALLDIPTCGNHVMALPHDLIAFPVKEAQDAPADLNIITRSAHELVYLTNKRGWQHIVLPRPGCGKAGLAWTTVGSMLEAILDNRFTCVTYERKAE